MNNERAQSFNIESLALVIIAVAAAARIWLAFHAHWPSFSDSRDYHVLAKNILDGNGYVQVYHGENPIHEGFTFHAYRMPGYPLFLALIYWAFGFHTIAAYISQALIEVVGLFLFWKLARQVLPSRAAVIALLFLGCNIFWTSLLMTEALFNTLVIASTLWAVSRKTKSSLIETFFIGVLVATIVFIRPVGLLLVPLLLWKTSVRSKVLLLLPLLICLGCWSYRNNQLLGKPVLLSTNFGWHNAPTFGIDRAQVFTQLRSEQKNEAAINQELTHQIVQRVMNDPVNGVRIFISRFFEMLSLEPPHEIRQFIFKRTFSESTSAMLQIFWYQFWIVYGLAILGMIMNGKQAVVSIGASLTVVTIAFHGLMSDGSFRFFAPWYFVVCMFAGLGLHSILTSCQKISK